ncbi:MAG: DUF2027 domain-containing protein [Muribaculaceae bacterium]|nr:DUF2027 domain-containing protein [Muribaculaceae bacterium]
MAKIGDRVRFLNSVGGGIIKRIEGNIAYVDDDGFETPTLLKECVVVAPAEDTAHKVAATLESVSTPEHTPASQPQSAPLPEETPEGEKLNIVLAFEPADSRRLNSTTFDTYLVNDSNYYLYFTYMTRSDTDTGWITRYAGVVEPNIQVFLEEIEGTDLPSMDRVAIQAVAFKMEREFKLKSPVAVEMPLDTTKFFKLHCFRQSPYFDKDVIALEIVRDDIVRQRSVMDSSRIEEGIKAKKAIDRQAKRPVVKHKREQRKGEVIEVDLHVGELLDTTAGLSPADILNLQIDEFRKVMDANLRNKGQKIVFIHGKGEGVLRNALMKELNHRYKGHPVQDASFREYGFGATQVTI